jgi:tetratricopeptide (TPR) repeat protein
MGKQDYSNAVEDFTSAIQLFELRGGLEIYLTLEQPSAEYIDSYRTRGVAQANLNKYKEGIVDLSTAVRLHKDDPKLLYDRGYLEEKTGMKKDAIRDYYRAGMLYADSSMREPAQECITRLDSLDAKEQADTVRLQLIPKKPKSDLPK